MIISNATLLSLLVLWAAAYLWVLCITLGKDKNRHYPMFSCMLMVAIATTVYWRQDAEGLLFLLLILPLLGADFGVSDLIRSSHRESS